MLARKNFVKKPMVLTSEVFGFAVTKAEEIIGEEDKLVMPSTDYIQDRSDFQAHRFRVTMVELEYEGQRKRFPTSLSYLTLMPNLFEE